MKHLILAAAMAASAAASASEGLTEALDTLERSLPTNPTTRAEQVRADILDILDPNSLLRAEVHRVIVLCAVADGGTDSAWSSCEWFAIEHLKLMLD